MYKSAHFPYTGGSPNCQHQASVIAKDSATTLACNPMQIRMATEPTFVSNTLSVSLQPRVEDSFRDENRNKKHPSQLSDLIDKETMARRGECLSQVGVSCRSPSPLSSGPRCLPPSEMIRNTRWLSPSNLHRDFSLFSYWKVGWRFLSLCSQPVFMLPRRPQQEDQLLPGRVHRSSLDPWQHS